MYILINKDRTAVNEDFVTSNVKMAVAPAGWQWIDVNDKEAQALILKQRKAELVKSLSSRALDERRAVMPDYKLQNAALGIYDSATTAAIKSKCEAYRNEFYRVKELIEASGTYEEAIEHYGKAFTKIA